MDHYEVTANAPSRPGQNKLCVKVVLAKELSKKYNPDNENDKSDNEPEEEVEYRGPDVSLPQFLLSDKQTPKETHAWRSRLFEIERPAPPLWDSIQQ